MVLDTTNKAHHCVDVDGSRCCLDVFGVIRNTEGSFIRCFSWADDGKDDFLGLDDGWNDPGWYFRGEDLDQLPEVLCELEHRFLAWHMLVYVPQQRVLWRWG